MDVIRHLTRPYLLLLWSMTINNGTTCVPITNYGQNWHVPKYYKVISHVFDICASLTHGN